MQSFGGDRSAIAIFDAHIARSLFMRLLTAQPITRLEPTGQFADRLLAFQRFQSDLGLEIWVMLLPFRQF